VLPYEAIWELIMEIHSTYEIPFSTSKKVKEYDEELVQDIIDYRHMFLFQTLDTVKCIDEMMDGYNKDIDFTYRFKDEVSIIKKFSNQTITKQTYKIANDILGMRFVLKATQDELQQLALQFKAKCPTNTDICTISDLSEGKSNDDGYKAIHIYIRPNNKVFPIEIQLWTRTNALLNEYLHDNIYKIEDKTVELDLYAVELRDWLESVPAFKDHNLKSYVDFIYEKGFSLNNQEDEEGDIDE
jgi:ppGpp synthetase/RelA/SpoT-type nucleotidyltranferase